MAFTDNQVRLLKAKLDPRYIRARNSNGSNLSYVEGWHAIAEANRIFGYEAWDRRTVSASCVWTEAKAKEHLRYVASQPCVICGRSPSHAHHVRYAQRRGLGIKVSDEFTVPLCATHHGQLNNTTKEREWWQERNVDPLIIACTLWRESQRRFPLPEQKPANSQTDLAQGRTEAS